MFWKGFLAGIAAWLAFSIVVAFLVVYLATRERRNAERQSVAEERRRAVDEAEEVIRGDRWR